MNETSKATTINDEEKKAIKEFDLKIIKEENRAKELEAELEEKKLYIAEIKMKVALLKKR